jgi:hypothetical protein
VVKYHGLARRYLTPPRFLMRPLLNGGTLAGLMDERPLATPEYEQHALTLFRLDLSAEEFAARFGHQFAMFNYDRYTYRAAGMTAWVDQLSAFFFADNLVGRLRAAREKYLSETEITRVEAFERDPF